VDADLKRRIASEAGAAGASVVGFAPAARWEERGEVPPAFRPSNVYPFAKTVIVMGMPIPIPMLDTSPSIVYSELYKTANRLLDDAAYKLTVLLSGQGQRAAFFPRDGYGDISVLVGAPEAAFSHVLAAWYAGLGTIGYNHALLTPEYGPRVRFVSVFTDAEVEPDAMMEKDLCVRCGMCERCCPMGAFSGGEGPIAVMDKQRCARYSVKLRDHYRSPCGVCIKVCPVGRDREIHGDNAAKYLNERARLEKDPGDPEYADWAHMRKHGSKRMDG